MEYLVQWTVWWQYGHRPDLLSGQSVVLGAGRQAKYRPSVNQPQQATIRPGKWKTTVTGLRQDPLHLMNRSPPANGHHLRPWHHHRRHSPVAEIQCPGKQFVFKSVDQPILHGRIQHLSLIHI